MKKCVKKFPLSHENFSFSSTFLGKILLLDKVSGKKLSCFANFIYGNGVFIKIFMEILAIQQHFNGKIVLLSRVLQRISYDFVRFSA